MQKLPGLKRLLPEGELDQKDSTEQTSSTTEDSEGDKAQMGAASVEDGKQSLDRVEEGLDPKESTTVQRRYASELEAAAQLAAPLAVTKATQADSEGEPCFRPTCSENNFPEAAAFLSLIDRSVRTSACSTMHRWLCQSRGM